MIALWITFLREMALSWPVNAGGRAEGADGRRGQLLHEPLLKALQQCEHLRRRRIHRRTIEAVIINSGIERDHLGSRHLEADQRLAMLRHHSLLPACSCQSTTSTSWSV